MTTTLPPTLNERILLFGAPGTGKTTSALSMYRAARELTPDSKLVAINTDGAGTMQRMLSGKWRGLAKGVEILDVFEYEDWAPAVAHALSIVKPGCVLLIDNIGDLWDHAQDYYDRQTYGPSAGDYWLEQQVKITKQNIKNPGVKLDDPTRNDWRDWRIVKRLYFEIFTRIYARTRCHLLCTSWIRDLRLDGMFADKPPERAVFGGLGAMPMGHKSLGHRFDTVLATYEKGGAWWIYAVKDRERKLLRDVRVRSFAADYLQAVGGWVKPGQMELGDDED